jgi:threonine aldolase
MRAAMMDAELGDDVLGDDPTVQALESAIAECLGKEAALFTPSGTMANQLAIRSVCEPGDEIIAHRDSHIIHYETGAPAALSGCMISPQDGAGGLFDADDVLASIRMKDVHNTITRMVVVENTHNRGGGTIWPLDQFESLAECAGNNDIHVHVDGARLFNAAAAGGYSPGDFARSADTVSVCFSKALGAPVGSALAGSTQVIDRARRFRKMFGGTMRQSGLLAGAALYALHNNVGRLAEDHENARVLAGELATIDGIRLENAPDETPSNMVFFEIDDADAFCDALEEHGVSMISMGPGRVRAVTHLDVDRNDVLAAARACAIVATSNSPRSRA